MTYWSPRCQRRSGSPAPQRRLERAPRCQLGLPCGGTPALPPWPCWRPRLQPCLSRPPRAQCRRLPGLRDQLRHLEGLLGTSSPIAWTRHSTGSRPGPRRLAPVLHVSRSPEMLLTVPRCLVPGRAVPGRQQLHCPSPGKCPPPGAPGPAASEAPPDATPPGGAWRPPATQLPSSALDPEERQGRLRPAPSPPAAGSAHPGALSANSSPAWDTSHLSS